MEKRLQKIYLTSYNLMIVQELWQAHYQILSIVFLKEFVKLNVNMDTLIILGNRHNYCNCFLEYANYKDDLIECQCLYCNKNYRQNLDEIVKE